MGFFVIPPIQHNAADSAENLFLPEFAAEASCDSSEMICYLQLFFTYN